MKVYQRMKKLRREPKQESGLIVEDYEMSELEELE